MHISLFRYDTQQMMFEASLIVFVLTPLALRARTVTQEVTPAEPSSALPRG